MTHQASSKRRRKPIDSLETLGLLAFEYFKPSNDLEMVFNTETGELERGRSNRPNSNIVLLY